MTKDPICCRQLYEEEAAEKKEFDGKTYYFCSLSCKSAFERKPEKFARTESEDPEMIISFAS